MLQQEFGQQDWPYTLLWSSPYPWQYHHRQHRMGCCAKTSSQTSSLQSKTSLATEKYLVAQVNTALVRAAYQGAVVEFATDTTRGATEVSQAIVAIIARLRSKNVTAPVAVGLLTTESVCVANERRL